MSRGLQGTLPATLLATERNFCELQILPREKRRKKLAVNTSSENLFLFHFNFLLKMFPLYK